MEYIKLSYHHLNFEDRTALMLESRKEGFSPIRANLSHVDDISYTLVPPK